MTKRLVKLAPSLLVGSQLLVSLGRHLQPLCYIGHNYQILQLYQKIKPQRLILPCTPPSLRLPRLIGLLLRGVSLLCCSLIHSHGLCTRRRSWARGNNTRPDARGCVGTTHARFSFISPSAVMWAIARRLISAKVLGRFLMSDSLKGPGQIPFLNVWTIIVSSLVLSFTTCAPKRLTNSFSDSP